MDERLRRDPKTSAYMNDPDFVRKLQQLKMNPNSLLQHMQDSRIMDALSVLLGVDIKSMGAGKCLVTALLASESANFSSIESWICYTYFKAIPYGA